MGNIALASGSNVFDGSSCFSLGLNAIQVISLDNASLSDSMGTLTLNDLDGGIVIKNGSSITSGSSEG